jgi:CheY-like chemotaxis protein
MPGMNGWEFIEHYNELDPKLHNSNIVVMLTTSGNPDDKSIADNYHVISEFRTKPLTIQMLEEVISKLAVPKPSENE